MLDGTLPVRMPVTVQRPVLKPTRPQGPVSLKTQVVAAPPNSTSAGVMAKLALGLVLFDVFLTFSRAMEIAVILSGVNIPVLLVVRGIILAAALLSPWFVRSFSSQIGSCLLLFTAWMFVCWPFSEWRGGSLMFAIKPWMMTLAMFFVLRALVRTTTELVLVLKAICFSGVFIAVVGALLGGGDRFNIGFNQDLGTLGNANDMAGLLLMSLPCAILYFQLNPRKLSFGKLAVGLSLPLMLKTISSTGSRGALLTLMVLGAGYFLTASGFKRVKVVALALIAGLGFSLLAPEALIQRYKTLLPFASDVQNGVAQSAEESSASRELVLRESISQTLQHPLFGVGPGVFDVAFSKIAQKGGVPGKFLVSHNTYTEVSSECGLIGFFSYVASMVFAFRAVRRVRRRTRGVPGLERLAAVSLCIQMVLLAFTVLAFFASLAWVPDYVVLAALADILRRVAEPEIEAERQRSAMALARA